MPELAPPVRRQRCVKEFAGLAKLGHVALDGTKIKANASKHKAMSYERMKTRETELRAEVDRWLEAAQAANAQEDKGVFDLLCRELDPGEIAKVIGSLPMLLRGLRPKEAQR